MSSPAASVESYPHGPIAIRSEYVTPTVTTLRVREVDDTVLSRDFSVIGENGSILMKVTGKTISRNLRREFTSASGLPLFELRRNPAAKHGNAWSLSLPGALEGDAVLSVDYRSFLLRARFDIKFRNLAPPSADDFNGYRDHIALEVRGQDLYNFTADVMCEGKRIMHLRREINGADARAAYKHAYGHRMGWAVTVAENIDLALAAIIVILLAELRT